MIAIDNLVDIFSFDPSLDLFNTLNNRQRKEILKRYSMSSIMFHSWQQNMLNYKVVDVINKAIDDGDEKVIVKIIDELKDVKYFGRIVSYCLDKLHSPLFFPIAKYLMGIGDNIDKITHYAAKGGHHDIILLCINKGYKPYLFNVDNIAAEYGHADILYDMMKRIDTTKDIGFSEKAAKGGHTEIVKALIKMDPEASRPTTILNSVRYGHLDIFKLFDTDRYNILAEEAAEYGHKNIVDYILETKIDRNNMYIYDWNRLAEAAAKGGHTAIVMTMVEGFRNKNGIVKSANNYNDIAKAAIENGHSDLALLFSTPINWEQIAISAAKDDNLKLIGYAITNNITNKDKVASTAAKYGYINIVKLLYHKDLNWNRIASNAAKGNYMDIVRMAINNGATNWKAIATNIARYGDKEFITYLYNKGVENSSSLCVDLSKLNYDLHIDCYKYFNV